MPVLYLAKVNLNSDIFDVYNHRLVLDDVFELIYKSIMNGTDYITKKTGKYINSYGNPIEFVSESKYVFQEIYKKENGIITGKLVKSFNRPIEKLDDLSKSMEMNYIEESVSIYFYYDVYKEMITFCERKSFGYVQFMNAFTNILNKCVSKYKFEIFLQKDKDILEKNESSKNGSESESNANTA